MIARLLEGRPWGNLVENHLCSSYVPGAYDWWCGNRFMEATLISVFRDLQYSEIALVIVIPSLAGWMAAPVCVFQQTLSKWQIPKSLCPLLLYTLLFKSFIDCSVPNCGPCPCGRSDRTLLDGAKVWSNRRGENRDPSETDHRSVQRTEGKYEKYTLNYRIHRKTLHISNIQPSPVIPVIMTSHHSIIIMTATLDANVIPHPSESLPYSELTVAIKPNSVVPDLGAKAWASMQMNKLALLRRVCQVQAKHTAIAPQPPIPIKTMRPPKAPRQITYRPLQREAGFRLEDIKSFRLTKDYTEYGSSNREWRNVSRMGKQ